MKPGIHPKYQDCTVTCSCGNVFQTKSTKSELRIDLCSVCHPFYTGEQRIVDTAGQVERFTKRMESAQARDAGKSKRQRRLEEAARQRAEQEAEVAAQREAAAKEERTKRRAEREAREAEAAAKAEAEAAAAAKVEAAAAAEATKVEAAAATAEATSAETVEEAATEVNAEETPQS